jgi:hypothetical protein
VLNGKDSRIGNGAAIGLLIFAAIADGLSLIPFVGDLVGPAFWILASVYLWRKGCGLLNAKQLATRLISMVAEMIPVVQEFPLIMAGVVAVIVFIRLEDKARAALGGDSEPAATQGPLNQEGVRLPAPEDAPAPLNVDGVRIPSLPPSEDRPLAA